MKFLPVEQSFHSLPMADKILFVRAYREKRSAILTNHASVPVTRTSKKGKPKKSPVPTFDLSPQELEIMTSLGLTPTSLKKLRNKK